MSNPYETLPRSAFWRSAVADVDPMDISGLWQPKFDINKSDRIITLGSCFAQHIGRALARRGYGWADYEPAPFKFPDKLKPDFGYGVFSFRTGNVYTAKILRQWVELAYGHRPQIPGWERGGRVYDPLRPRIEPDGFLDQNEMLASRNATLAAMRRAFSEIDLFVFTFGLTEAWQDADGTEFAMCPGTVAGRFDPTRHQFVNHRFSAILSDMELVIAQLREVNPQLKFLFTVSPVPLTATASGKHVLTATAHSKAILRAVAGELAECDDRIDYFPSFEIITQPPFEGRFYADNKRSVRMDGVDFVMSQFFAGQGEEDTPEPRGPRTRRRRSERKRMDVICEEELLDAFGK